MDLIFVSSLVPGYLDHNKLKEVLSILFKENEYFKPNKYGNIIADIKINDDCFDSYIEDLLSHYIEKGDLVIEKGKDYLIIFPDRENEASYIGYITLKLNKKNNLLIKQDTVNILEKVIHLLKSPIAISSCKEVYKKYQTRFIQRDGYTEETYTVKDYSRGLTNAYWRMWFGREYIEFFGKEKLDNAPAYDRHYHNDIYFIQLFESPYDWNTPEGIKATERFKDAVGRETFYDPDNPEKVLKAPDFSHLLK